MSKKIVLISLSTPTFNNVRAASALPYHLIKGIRENNATKYNLEIYSFNINNIGTEDIRKIEIDTFAEKFTWFPISMPLRASNKLLYPTIDPSPTLRRYGVQISQ